MASPRIRPDGPAAPGGPPSAPPEAERAVATLLELLGEDPGRPGLRDTPARYARALLELTQGYDQDPAAILARVFDDEGDEMVVVRDIPFASLCEHHLLPFQGRATIAYLPDGRIVGLSKLSRLVHCYARRLQVQERLTREIADAIDTHLAPRGVAVVVHAEHTCMSLRGIRTPATMTTQALRGDLADGPSRAEFLALVREGARG